MALPVPILFSGVVAVSPVANVEPNDPATSELGKPASKIVPVLWLIKSSGLLAEVEVKVCVLVVYDVDVKVRREDFVSPLPLGEGDETEYVGFATTAVGKGALGAEVMSLVADALPEV